MLQVAKSTTIQGISSTEDGKQIATFYANINGESSNNNMTITDQPLYDENKKAVRTDKREFDDYVFSVEDEQEETEKV